MCRSFQNWKVRVYAPCIHARSATTLIVTDRGAEEWRQSRAVFVDILAEAGITFVHVSERRVPRQAAWIKLAIDRRPMALGDVHYIFIRGRFTRVLRCGESRVNGALLCLKALPILFGVTLRALCGLFVRARVAPALCGFLFVLRRIEADAGAALHRERALCYVPARNARSLFKIPA